MHLVDPGQRVVSVNDVYGGTYRLFSKVYAPKGYDFTYVSAEQANAGLATHLDEQTRIVWLESPTNPLLNVVDIAAAARRRARGRRARRGGQHLRVAVPAAAAGAGRRHRRPLDHQVPGRPLRPGRRLRRDERRSGRRAAGVPPEQPGRGARPARRLAGVARAEDAGSADAPALRERPRRGRAAGRPPRRPARALAGARRASGPRHRRSPDGRLRRDGVVPRRGRAAGARPGGEDPHLVARREPGRRREPDRDAGPDDARLHGRCAVRNAAQPGAAVRRDRGRGRPRRRSGRRARLSPRHIRMIFGARAHRPKGEGNNV